jgi:hypothetical protein
MATQMGDGSRTTEIKGKKPNNTDQTTQVRGESKENANPR